MPFKDHLSHLSGLSKTKVVGMGANPNTGPGFCAKDTFKDGNWLHLATVEQTQSRLRIKEEKCRFKA